MSPRSHLEIPLFHFFYFFCSTPVPPSSLEIYQVQCLGLMELLGILSYIYPKHNLKEFHLTNMKQS